MIILNVTYDLISNLSRVDLYSTLDNLIDPSAPDSLGQNNMYEASMETVNVIETYLEYLKKEKLCVNIAPIAGPIK